MRIGCLVVAVIVGSAVWWGDAVLAIEPVVAVKDPVNEDVAEKPANEVEQSELKAVAGRWTRTVPTANGPVTIVKEHVGKKTVLVATDAAGKVLYGHKSDFTVERQGKVRVLTFSNVTVTAGPNAGAVDKAPQSFLYRVTEKQFVEVWGVLEGDATPPRLVVWDRVPEPPQAATNRHPSETTLGIVPLFSERPGWGLKVITVSASRPGAAG